jgi:hypothetical protein
LLGVVDNLTGIVFYAPLIHYTNILMNPYD